mgnify:CR=1 FL=1
MNICSKISIYRITYISLLFLLVYSCDQKSITFSPGSEDGLEFKTESFDMDPSSSSTTTTPGYINQDLGPLLYVGNIPVSGDVSYVLFQINSQILQDNGLCAEDEGSTNEENQEIKNRGDIKFRLMSPTLDLENSEKSLDL